MIQLLVFKMMLLKENVIGGHCFCGNTGFLVDNNVDVVFYYYSFLPCHLPVTISGISFFILTENIVRKLGGYSIRFNSLGLH